MMVPNFWYSNSYYFFIMTITIIIIIIIIIVIIVTTLLQQDCDFLRYLFFSPPVCLKRDSLPI